ncbi:hypothetical protein TNCV_3008961 [Trichonephila clavipes]|nr:hypothetical protein TNCV_3008961 [Trichonephila clavipes]
MENEKLNSLMLVCTQNDVAIDIDCNDVINDFLGKNLPFFDENLRFSSTVTVTQQRKEGKNVTKSKTMKKMIILPRAPGMLKTALSSLRANTINNHSTWAVSSLVVRASDSRPEDLGSMPDATKYPPSTHGVRVR